jgi:aminoglycoside phosphotransferase (APT) family kinase protein
LTGPPATGVRPDWSELPPHLRAALDERLGAPIVSAETQPGGFSPGIAVRVVTADGQRVFVKAVGPTPNPDSPRFHRNELRIVSSMPHGVAVPRLLWSLDEEEGGWVVLVFEDVEGRHPSLPWRAAELERVIDGLAALATALTPSPVAADSAGKMLASSINSWHLLRDDQRDGLDDWSARNLDRLVALEEHVADAVEGETLVHLDVRADNLLLTEDRVYLVDWPHAHVGATWLDAIGFAPSVAMQGGPQPEELLPRWPGAGEADPDAVTAAVASVAGFFTQRALLPPPPGLPTLRAFQAAQGEVARAWLARRTGWT